MAEKSKREAWEPPKLVNLGHVGDVLQKATGKISVISSDSGITEKKPSGAGGG